MFHHCAYTNNTESNINWMLLCTIWYRWKWSINYYYFSKSGSCSRNIWSLCLLLVSFCKYTLFNRILWVGWCINKYLSTTAFLSLCVYTFYFVPTVYVGIIERNTSLCEPPKNVINEIYFFFHNKIFCIILKS